MNDDSIGLVKDLLKYWYRTISLSYCFGLHDKTRDCKDFIIGDYYAKTNKGENKV